MRPLLASAVCPVFVGRSAERDAIFRSIDQTAGGPAQFVLVSGEAGIGKSRLVVEAKAYAANQGFTPLLDGYCLEGDDDAPYAPLLDLFQNYFAHLASSFDHSTDPLPANVSSAAYALLRLLPDLAFRFPQFAQQANLSASPALDPEEGKRQLFAAMVHFVTEQAARHPVLMVLEDIHWCDDLSRELLLHLLYRCRSVPLLLLATYRGDERNPHLTQWLGRLVRERLAQELSLSPLARGEVEAMLRSILGTATQTPHSAESEIDPAILDAIYARSEGNPFFVEELVKSLTTAGNLASVQGAWRLSAYMSSIPRSIEASVQQRMAYLSADAKELLALAAIAGRRFDVSLLREVLRCDEAHLLSVLKEVIAAQLVIEEATDHFAFRHALTQQAVAAGLLLREHQRLHRDIAETLERLSTAPHARERYLGDLAYHSYEAGMWRQALLCCSELGEKALALYAHHTAIDHFTRALDAARYLPEIVPCALYLRRGQAYEALGEFDRALSDYESALDAAREADDGKMKWRSVTAIGFLWTGHDYGRAGIWFQEALALAEQMADPTPRAHSLNRLGNWYVNTGRVREGLAAHQEALLLFESQQNLPCMAETLELLGFACYFTGDPAATVRDYFGRAVELLRQLDDKGRLSSVLTARALDSAPETIESTFSALRGRDECLQDLEEARHLANQIDSQSGRAFVEMAAAYVLASFGEFGPALARAQEALSIAEGIEHHEWIAAANGALGLSHLLMLDPDRAVACLEAGLAGARAIGSTIWVGYLTPYLAMGYILKQDFVRSEATLNAAMPRDQPPTDFFERQVARVWGELSLARREAATALRIADDLLVSSPGGHPGGPARPQPIPHLLALKGEALLALGRPGEAAQALEQAKVGAQQRQAPSVLWRVHRSLGRAHRLVKDEDQATREWASAREVISRLAATIDEAQLREHFTLEALATLPGEKPGAQQAARKAASHWYGGLSVREREVASLIAAGSTNREIAARLIVTERTAEAHVSNILAKLGFSTRAQIAAWATEKGLTNAGG